MLLLRCVVCCRFSLLRTQARVCRVLMTVALKVPRDLSDLPGGFGTSYLRHLCSFFLLRHTSISSSVTSGLSGAAGCVRSTAALGAALDRVSVDACPLKDPSGCRASQKSKGSLHPRPCRAVSDPGGMRSVPAPVAPHSALLRGRAKAKGTSPGGRWWRNVSFFRPRPTWSSSFFLSI